MLLAGACSPQSFTMNIEMRYPSKSGLDLAGKSIAVVCLGNGSAADSTFSEGLVQGFAERLEKEYFGGEQGVSTYKIIGSGDDYSSRDSLVNLVVDSGDDVVFLFGTPEFGELGLGDNKRSTAVHSTPDSAYTCVSSLPFTVKLWAYDSMDKDDKVYSFTGSNAIKPEIFNDGTLTYPQAKEKVWSSVRPLAEKIGLLSCSRFLNTWKTESYSIIYYDNGNDAWIDGAVAASEYRWTDAMKEWMKLLSTKNMQKRSCAEYNLGLGCFMMGQLDLALKWLDASDKDCPVSLSSELRKRILARKK